MCIRAFYFLTALAVLILRKRELNSKRPIVAPLVCVLIFLAFTAYALIFVFIPVHNKFKELFQIRSVNHFSDPALLAFYLTSDRIIACEG